MDKLESRNLTSNLTILYCVSQVEFNDSGIINPKKLMEKRTVMLSTPKSHHCSTVSTQFILRLSLVFLCFIAFETTATEFIGRATCINCHSEQNTQWSGSHHDLAMQLANNGTVLGDFDSATLSVFGVTSSFCKKEGKFIVRTDGPDGQLQDYEIKYAFGVNPLQQYLVEFPGGRLQALSLTWDARPKEQGGQRWFHLYPDEKIDHNDELDRKSTRLNSSH